MASPIEQLQIDIAALETENNQLYKRMTEVRTSLANYKTLLQAFILVSSDPDLYDRWVATVKATTRPEPTPFVDPVVVPLVSN